MGGREFLSRETVYQIYPASFCDSNGDGWGDIPGIISRLDYISSLGVGAIWLSPVYPSPMKDMGYDIADYRDIDPRFGTLADFDRLISECSARGIKVIMDLVVNHTSSQHPWFREAMKDRSSPYWDYYIIRPGKKGGRKPPNNWTTSFMTSAWSRVPEYPGMWYLHLYSPEQPDLNWDNPAVLEEVEDIMRFWMDRGVFGFRCDVISEIYKTGLEDGRRRKLSELSLPRGHEHFVAQPGCHRILKRIRKDVIEPRGGILIGECFGVDSRSAPAFLDGELDTLFSFDLAQATGTLNTRIAEPERVESILREWQGSVSFNGNYLENHDQHRSVGKYCRSDPEHRVLGAKMLLTLLFSLRGGTFIFQGQELGAVDYPKLRRKDSHDFVADEVYRMFIRYGLIPPLAWKLARNLGRDDPRAPMVFDGSEGHGFTAPGVTPWQAFNPESATINVESQDRDPDSVLNYFRKLVLIRRELAPLSEGDIEFLSEMPKGTIGICRGSGSSRTLTLVNMTDEPVRLAAEPDLGGWDLVISDCPRTEGYLSPYEADIYLLSEKPGEEIKEAINSER